MTTEEFVPAIERVVRGGAVFSALDDADRRMVAEVIKEAADFAVFGFLFVLDGVSAMVDAEKKVVWRYASSKRNQSC